MALVAVQVRKDTRRTAIHFERKPFYSPSEVAVILGVSAQTVRDWIHDDRLFAVRLSERLYRIPLGALLQKLGHPARIRHEDRTGRASDDRADARRLAAEHRPR